MPNPTHLLYYDNGYFKVLEYNGKDPKYNSHTWKCQCRCGNIKILRTDVIKRAATKSCGCVRSINLKKRGGVSNAKKFQPTHGLSKHPLFRVWGRIIERCYKLAPSHKFYKYYRGKGIKMAPEWINDFKVFYEWAIKNGWQKGLTIDRVNSNGHYEPDNCQFITRQLNSQKAGCSYRITDKKPLSIDDILQIRKRLQLGESGNKIALDFNVHRKTIYNIRDKKSWKNL